MYCNPFSPIDGASYAHTHACPESSLAQRRATLIKKMIAISTHFCTLLNCITEVHMYDLAPCDISNFGLLRENVIGCNCRLPSVSVCLVSHSSLEKNYLFNYSFIHLFILLIQLHALSRREVMRGAKLEWPLHEWSLLGIEPQTLYRPYDYVRMWQVVSIFTFFIPFLRLI